MAPSFEPSCPVLYFRPRGHTHPGPRNERAWLLWPTWVYRVVCPKTSDRLLNVFQEAVLGMLCAGNCTLEEIAQALVLNPELVAHIATRDLVDRGFLEENTLSPTAFGRQAIAKGAAQTPTKSVGFVFQDPWSGRLWPAFSETLPFMDIDYSPEGYPDLLLGGTKGRPWRQHAFCLLPPTDLAPSQPAAEDILKASYSARRARERTPADLYREEDDAAGELAQQFEAFREVSFIDESPEPHFLVTYLYVPHDRSGDVDWYACDPFGTGYNMSFKREVAERAREYAPLSTHVSRCLGERPEMGGAPVLGRERAEALVGRELDGLEVSPAARDEFIEFQLKVLQVESAEAARAQTYQLIREAYTQVRRILEVLCEQVNGACRDASVRDVLFLDNVPRNAGQLRDIVERINVNAAREVGFTTAGLRRIVTTGANKLRDCADKKARGALAAEFMLAIHTAVRQPSHPFRAIAAKAPDFLHDVERIMEPINKAAHAGEINTAQLGEVYDLMYRIARLILQSNSPRTTI